MPPGTRRDDPHPGGSRFVAYALAVTSGVPVLHPEREPMDGLALATKAIEIVGLIAATHLLLLLLLRDRPVALLTTERTLT
jgi:hypothetical protein